MKGCPKCGQQFAGDEEFCSQDGETLIDLDKRKTDPLVGTTLDGRYAIQHMLGEGGMGVVYLAIHAVIGKKCAVKVLRQEIANENDVSERFIQEARSAAAIGDEHVIEITDFGQTPDGSPYFVMEYLEGSSLHDVLKETPKLEVNRALHIIDQCCQALSKAHEVGVIHRDLKPENLFLIRRGTDSDYVKVLDFGIAKVARETGRLTRTGTIFGTPQYMSPEQAAGTSMDERTDVYSLGIIMYEMLCGKVPFEADTFMGVLTKHLYEEPIPPSRLSPPVDLNEAVESVVLKAIAKKRDRRYRNMGKLQEDVAAVLDGKTPQSLHEKIRESTVPPSPSEVVGDSRSRRTARTPSKKKTSKTPLVIGVASVLLVAIIAVFVFVGGGSRENGPPPGKTPPVISAPMPQPPPAPPKVDVSAQPTDTITITSNPPGASLYKDGKQIATLPAEVMRPAVGLGAVVYQVKHAEYQDREVTVTTDLPNDIVVELSPEVAPEASSSADGKKKTADGESRKKKQRKKKTKGQRLGGDIVDPWG